MDDLISKQAAIDALLTLGFVWDDGLSDVEKEELDYAIHGIIMAYKDRIEQLASVQPEQCDFEKQLHDMFDHIWYCKIDHPVFQDTVGDLMRAVIEAHYRTNGSKADKMLEKQADRTTDDCISRQAVIDEITEYGSGDAVFMSVGELKRRIELSPSVQTEACEYFALCRHGRDENKLRAHLKFCEYCNEDSDGYVKPIEKNNHAFVRFGMDGWELSLKANGWHGSAKIRYCPMCGRDLLVK